MQYAVPVQYICIQRENPLAKIAIAIVFAVIGAADVHSMEFNHFTKSVNDCTFIT